MLWIAGNHGYLYVSWQAMKESCPDMIYKSYFTFYCIMQFVWSWILSFSLTLDCALLVMIQHIILKATLQREAYCDINTHGCTENFFSGEEGTESQYRIVWHEAIDHRNAFAYVKHEILQLLINRITYTCDWLGWYQRFCPARPGDHYYALWWHSSEPWEQQLEFQIVDISLQQV